MATIDPIGPDEDLTNNSKTKTWNNMSSLVRGGTTTFNYVFVNHGRQTEKFRARLDVGHLPDGWQLQDSRSKAGKIVLEPGQEFRGTLSLVLPADKVPENGAFSEARIALIEEDSGRVYRQHEWFEIHDTSPPLVSNYRVVMLKDHTIASQALVADQQSGVLEATGVKTGYSVDGGKTWATKAHNYKTGNFVRPTLFETVVGPFPG